jgi:branched-chain amino acid transport system substrate-binding protein
MSPVVLVFVGVTLAASFNSNFDKNDPDAIAATEHLLATSGQVLGAAATCSQIDRVRVRAAMLRVEELIDKSAADNRQYYVAGSILSRGIDSGRRSIKQGESDCRRADVDLTDLERTLVP